jgi:hypothetical protein
LRLGNSWVPAFLLASVTRPGLVWESAKLRKALWQESSELSCDGSKSDIEFIFAVTGYVFTVAGH